MILSYGGYLFKADNLSLSEHYLEHLDNNNVRVL